MRMTSFVKLLALLQLNVCFHVNLGLPITLRVLILLLHLIQKNFYGLVNRGFYRTDVHPATLPAASKH